LYPLSVSAAAVIEVLSVKMFFGSAATEPIARLNASAIAKIFFFTNKTSLFSIK
jgi:hypothetical protein